MRKLERQMNFAVSNKGNWCGSNTQVTYNEHTDCSQVRLHGHLIATVDHSTSAVKLDSCGYETVTTKSRLNALLEEFADSYRVIQKDFTWYVVDSYDNSRVPFWSGMTL